MDCKRCDRCGKVYPYNSIMYETGSYIVAAVDNNQKTGWMYEGQRIEFKDICEDCRKSFDAWFNMKKENEK